MYWLVLTVSNDCDKLFGVGISHQIDKPRYPSAILIVII